MRAFEDSTVAPGLVVLAREPLTQRALYPWQCGTAQRSCNSMCIASRDKSSRPSLHAPYLIVLGTSLKQLTLSFYSHQRNL